MKYHKNTQSLFKKGYINFSLNKVNGNSLSNKVKSLIIYGDFLLNKKKNALKDNIGKSGIYKLVHKISKKSYVGSSKDLNRRFKEYYNIGFKKIRVEKGNSRIYKALLDDGYDSFNLEILEYCDKNSIT
jgi:hypothetical protein